MSRPLLAQPIECGAGPRLVISEFREEGEPAIEQTCWYMWRLIVEGTTEFPKLQLITVSLKLATASPLSIGDFRPTQEAVKAGEVTVEARVGVPELGIRFGIHMPLVRKMVASKHVAKKEIVWEFYEVELGKRLTECIEGAFGVVFDEGSEYVLVPVELHIVSSFYGAGPLWRKRVCSASPAYDGRIVELCPYDPELGSAKEGSLVKREMKYDWDLEKGILTKTGIENVSLRRRTLTKLFETLRHGVERRLLADLLRKAGAEVGRGFALEIQDRTSKKLDLRRWSDYDASAGMGRLLFDSSSPASVSKVVLRNSFEAASIRAREPVCHFFEGYIGGVLSTVCETKIVAKEVSCIAQNKEVCTFEVQQT